MITSSAAIEDSSAPIGPQHAARAWLRVRPSGPSPEVIEDLKPRRSKHVARSYIFRLAGVDDDGNAIVAKLSRTAAREAFLHSTFLEPMLVGTPRLVSVTEEPAVHGMTWLFLEDVGDEWWDARADTAAARWLARLHAAPVESVPVGQLPSQDLDQRFVRARQELDAVAEGGRPRAERIFLARLARLFDDVCDALDGQRDLFAQMPNAVVHGDLVAKNARVRWRDGMPTFFVLDWEHAGFGTPAVDLWWLANSGAAEDVYFSVIQGHWPGVGRSDFSSMVQLGALLRLMTSAVWEVPSLRYASAARPVRRLRDYEVGISRRIRNLGGSSSSTDSYDVPRAR